MSVRAKFTCQSKTESKYGNEIQVSIKLSPVCSGSEENKQFFKYTPTGLIELGTVNKAAGDAFELGKEYFVDFTPAT